MKRKTKLELMLAIIMTATLASLTYTSLIRNSSSIAHLYTRSSEQYLQSTMIESTQQVILENIRGELKKGEFETTIQGIRKLVLDYDGGIPSLLMRYENEHWSGTMSCKMAADNVTLFTFNVTTIINQHGKVMYTAIDIKEIEVYQTQGQQAPLSEIVLYLYELVENPSPFLNQLGIALPFLTTGLAWIVEGLIVGVPLCFASLGVVLLADRGIIPVWKKQFQKKHVQKETAQIVGS